MASIENGSYWRGPGGKPAPWSEVAPEGVPYASSNRSILEVPLDDIMWADEESGVVRSHSCCGCYCIHRPACPPCECAFHNPNVP